MPSLDIFNNDAFSLVNLTKAINDVPFVPHRLADLGLFAEDGIATTSLAIEKVGLSLSLVPAGQRGQPATPKGNDKRTIIPVQCIHLPQRGSVLADQVQNLRAFGSESELETVQNVVNKRLAKMRRDLDATIEYQRMGAIKGQVLDSDGATVLLDLFTSFGVAQSTYALALSNVNTHVRVEVLKILDLIATQLGGIPYTGVRALCSPTFFEALIGNADVLKAFDRWNDGEFLRSDPRYIGFPFAGVVWEQYRGQVGAIKFVEDNTAYLIPEGVPDLFSTSYAPADYTETVNTIGLPYYAKQEPMDMGKGIEIETQSNPISVCTRPTAVVKVTAT